MKRDQTAGPARGTGFDRRRFLGAVGGASSVAAAGVGAVPVTATPAQAYDPGPDETRARYRETAEVKAFYRTNGYETLKK
ncbi:MAG: formate dehydrogenase [Methylobacteriaceae bacterium]|nr:formate dehydrogenase [Methylobacteriaceae bacterium]